MRLIVLFLLIPFTFAWMAVPTDSGPSAAPATEEGDLIFSHALHIEEMELLCDDCHGGVESSSTGRDNLLPTMDTCADCHEVEDEAECATCHRNVEDPYGPPPITDYSEKFSHERHLGADLSCESCHAAIAAKEVVQPYELPGMVSCVTCHEDNLVDNECLTCHMPDEELMPSSHVVGFERTHGAQAQRGAITAHAELTCVTCHEDTFCQDCHEGENLDRLTHPLNYEFTHALDAQSGAVDCASCHTDVQSFCESCHVENQVLPQTHRPGWVNGVDGGRHRFEAAADLGSCISCHESNADVVCSPCHNG